MPRFNVASEECSHINEIPSDANLNVGEKQTQLC